MNRRSALARKTLSFPPSWKSSSLSSSDPKRPVYSR
jgi:hypothetical protein